MPEQKLAVTELHKRYGDHEVLKGVSLAANAGDVISIIGPVKVPFCVASTSWKSPAKAPSA